LVALLRRVLMTSRERILAMFKGEKPDRVGRADAPWAETIARWRKEGLPAGVQKDLFGRPEADFASFCDFFDMDVRDVVKVDYSFRLPPRVIERAEDHHTVVDGDGVTCTYWRNQSGVPHYTDWLIKTPADWKKHRECMAPAKERLGTSIYGAYATGGYSDEPGPTYEEQKKIFINRPAGKFSILFIRGPYEGVMHQVGPERILYWLIEEPETVKDMFEVHADLAISMMETAVREGFITDGVFLGDDMSYKNGLLFSPAIYDEMLGPQHRRICEKAHELGMVTMLHCDGNFAELIPRLHDVGLDALQPLEVHAGLDVRKLVKDFGGWFVFVGNIGVDYLAKGGKDLEDEVKSKLKAAKKAKGYVFHSDHSVPPNVSWDNYKRAVELLDKYGRY
jgi:uroporphyrinogen decarboxylase